MMGTCYNKDKKQLNAISVCAAGMFEPCDPDIQLTQDYNTVIFFFEKNGYAIGYQELETKQVDIAALQEARPLGSVCAKEKTTGSTGQGGNRRPLFQVSAFEFPANFPKTTAPIVVPIND